MDNSVNFARRFAQLLWLLIHEPQNVDEQKGTLRALVAQGREGALHIGVHGSGLTINDQPVPSAFTGVVDLLGRLEAHGLVLLSTAADVAPAHLLAVARILAGEAVPNDGGAAAESKRVAAGVTTIRFATKPRMTNEIPRETPRATMAIPIDFDFGEVYDDPLAEAMARATPRNTMSIQTPTRSHDTGGLFAQFAANSGPTASYTELLAQLDKASDIGTVDHVLEGLAQLAEKSAAEGRLQEATDILCAVTNRERTAEHEIKRAIGMAHRRMAKPAVLRAVASQMVNVPEQLNDCIAVFTRAGEEGADALIELISDPAHQRHRRHYFDVLLQLKAGVPALLHMLRDSRWFVVRNAAELLGEMQVREAEKPLSELLLHNDEPVRRAASGALMRLGTPRAMQTINEALASKDHELRIEAATALGTRKDSQSVPTLLKALELEKEEVVQTALLLALGRHATPEAVKRLAAAAAPERRPFMRKASELRVAAVHGLAEAKTAEAIEALRSLQDDKEAAVKNAAIVALRRISRGDNRVTEP